MLALLWLLLVAPLTFASRAAAQEPPRAIPLEQLKSGSTFLAPETRARQDDLDVNPGMVWVEQGRKHWDAPDGAHAKSCAACHGEPATMTGVAASYPRIDAATGTLMSLEQRINACRATHQGAQPLDYESEPLLSLAALLAHQSRGHPIAVAIDGLARPHFEAGRRMFYQRQGQLDLACAECHESNWGKRLRAEPISQGHPTGYPIYRLEWQTLGSLHRRFRSCFNGVRAEPFASGAPEFVALELFLAWRASGLPVEAPAVRR